MLLTLWSAVPVAVAALHVVRHGGVLTGTDSALAGADQQQYLAAIREAGQHLLIADPFRLGSSAAVYLHPMYLLSGLLWRLGLNLQLSLLLWAPVAAGVLAVGIWAYVRRFLSPGEQLAAAGLSVCFFSPVLPALAWSGVSLSSHVRASLLLTSGEAAPAWQLWGYLHTVIVLGLLPLCLLATEAALSTERRTGRGSLHWYLAAAAAAGCAIGWLHPWQGIVLLGILGGLAAWGRFQRRYWLLTVPVLATVAPMAYLYILSRTNQDWRQFSIQNRAFHDPAWVLAATLGPLALPALAGIRLRAATVQDRVLVLWPVASVVVYLAVGQFPFHALQGISIPLAILAVRAYRRLSLAMPAGIVCVALLTLPGIAFQLDTLRTNIEHKYAPYWLTDGESAALRYVERVPAPGGVLSRYYLGMTVPAFTGRSVWVGHYVWTPDFTLRAARSEQLFAGLTPAAQAQSFVRSTGATFLIGDCQVRADLTPLLGPLLISARHFGCATVYRVRP